MLNTILLKPHQVGGAALGQQLLEHVQSEVALAAKDRGSEEREAFE